MDFQQYDKSFWFHNADSQNICCIITVPFCLFEEVGSKMSDHKTASIDSTICVRHRLSNISSIELSAWNAF